MTGLTRRALGMGAALFLGTGGMARAGAWDFSFASIDGGTLPLSAWRGRPILVANTASFCGYTPQYRELEAIWQLYRPRGLVVLGVPSNDFGGQEPGTAAEIKEFCEGTYSVDFPMADKVRVTGREAHPFFTWIVAQLGDGAAPRWNFHKFLVGPDGAAVAAWPSSVKPTDAVVTRRIEPLLAPS